MVTKKVKKIIIILFHKYEFNSIDQRSNILVANALNLISTHPVPHDQIHLARGKPLARKQPRAEADARELAHSPPAAAAWAKTVCTIIITLSQHIGNYYTVSLNRWLAVQEHQSISYIMSLPVNKRGLVCVTQDWVMAVWMRNCSARRHTHCACWS